MRRFICSNGFLYAEDKKRPYGRFSSFLVRLEKRKNICKALAKRMNIEYNNSANYKEMKGVHLYGCNERKYDFKNGT